MRRNGFLWLGFAALLLVVLAEIIGPILPVSSSRDVEGLIADQMAELSEDEREDAQRKQAGLGDPDAPPGLAIRALALVDGLVLWTVGLFASATLMRQSLHTRIRAIATPVFCLIVLILAIVMIIAAIGSLMLMLSLLLSVPFGTIVYLILFGSFRTGLLVSTLGVVSFLRAAGLLLLLGSSWRYLKNKSLILMIGTGYLCGIITGFALGLTPGIVHAIVDAVLAIIFGILAAIWALILLIRSLPGITAVVR